MSSTTFPDRFGYIVTGSKMYVLLSNVVPSFFLPMPNRILEILSVILTSFAKSRQTYYAILTTVLGSSNFHVIPLPLRHKSVKEIELPSTQSKTPNAGISFFLSSF